MDRTGRSLSNSASSESFSWKSPTREIAPVFQQFLECVYRLMQVNRGAFGFSGRVLIVLYESIYEETCATFSCNSEKMKKGGSNSSNSREIWGVFNDTKVFEREITNTIKIIYPGREEEEQVCWWELYGAIKKKEEKVELEMLSLDSPPVVDIIDMEKRIDFEIKTEKEENVKPMFETVPVVAENGVIDSLVSELWKS